MERVVKKHATATAHENLKNEAKLQTKIKTIEYEIRSKCQPYTRTMHPSLSKLTF